MTYYWFNREEILQNAGQRYSKEKAAEYYLENKEAVKKKSRDRHRTCQKKSIKEYQRKRFQQLIQYKKEALQSK